MSGGCLQSYLSTRFQVTWFFGSKFSRPPSFSLTCCSFVLPWFPRVQICLSFISDNDNLYLYGLQIDSEPYWGRVTHICVDKLTIIASDNGLSPGRRQAIIWTNAGVLLIGPLRTNFSEILIGIQTFSFKKMYLKMSSAKWRPFYLGLNVLKLLIIICKCMHHNNICSMNDNSTALQQHVKISQPEF